MKLEYAPYFLNFRHPFKLSTGIRTGTDTVLVKVSTDNCAGFGEATLPPYLKENKESVLHFLRKVNLSSFNENTEFSIIQKYLHTLEPKNTFALCAVEEAIFQLFSENNRIHPYFDFNSKKINCTYTLGVSSEDELEEKIAESKHFSHLKVKFDSESDRSSILSIRKYSHKPICVDVNQGWDDKNVNELIDFCTFLKDQGVELIEQPFQVNNLKKLAELKSNCQLPIIADEAIQGLSDFEAMIHLYDGINVKLLKCGGPIHAFQLLEKAKSLGKMTILGCMSESSCGVYHAASVSRYADLIDLDGPYLISNDPFSGFEIKDEQYHLGKLILKESIAFNSVN